MVVPIELDDEEKIQVLLVALALFLIALFISLCLALGCCPLNKWLTEREHKRRRQQLAAARILPYNRLHRNLIRHYATASGSKPAPPLVEHMGPPPAYEAALRATRLQSLTSNCLFPAGEQQSPDWLKTALSNSTSDALFDERQQLDLGDYFHQPREYPQLYGPPFDGSQPARQPRVEARAAPVMLRLWVKLMEPGELVERARAQTRKRHHQGEAAATDARLRRRVSLARQSSIPQLLGALMTTLAKSKSGSAICDSPPAAEPSPTPPAEAQLSSLASSADSAEEPPSASPQPPPPPPPPAAARAKQRRHSIPPIASSITSRVLHMNVASFSYAKDENLISTKKHNQLNFHHFYASALKATKQQDEKSGKMCQLLVSICDVENLLGSSSLNSRASARLAQHSSIYVKCEILAPKATNLTARLIRNPLKVLTHQQISTDTPISNNANHQQNHTTVDFAATLPAAAMDPLPVACRTTGPSGSGQPEAEVGERREPPGWRHEPAAEGKSIVVFNSIPKQIAQQQQLACSSATPSAAGSGHFSLNINTNTNSNTNTNGDESVQSPGARQQTVDLIQFDSVFVSPILSKSTLEQGHIRLRIYSQCRYVNETCLAELKLPLKQLMRAQTRDNLADADRKRKRADEDNQQQQQRQADLILDNLLANLVTASTGSPLGTLIEQISAEACEDSAGPPESETATPTRTGSFRLANWLSSAANTQDTGKGVNLQRASSSFGAALNCLDATTAAPEVEPEVAANWASEWHSTMIEKNYCRSLMVSHWLNYLVAPSYECQLIEEARAKLVLGLTYLPTSNRIIFNAHRASVEWATSGDSTTGDKQAIKKLRLQTDTSYLLRFLMLAEDRVLKRKQTACGRKPEWDSQEPVTFDLVNVQVAWPSFVVALVMRNSSPHSPVHSASNHAHPGGGGCGGSLQSLALVSNYRKTPGGALPAAAAPPSTVQSEPETVYRSTSGGGATCRTGRGAKRDLVIGHLVLADEIWAELRAQPRRQIIRQFKLL